LEVGSWHASFIAGAGNHMPQQLGKNIGGLSSFAAVFFFHACFTSLSLLFLNDFCFCFCFLFFVQLL
jgi:hypothetical protein